MYNRKEGVKAWRKRNAEHASHYSQAYYRFRHDRVIVKLGGKCFVCGRQHTRMEIHHLNYEMRLPAGWRTYTDVENHPENYRLLCVLCHRFVTLAMAEPSVQPNLLELLKISKPKEAIPAV